MVTPMMLMLSVFKTLQEERICKLRNISELKVNFGNCGGNLHCPEIIIIVLITHKLVYSIYTYT